MKVLSYAAVAVLAATPVSMVLADRPTPGVLPMVVVVEQLEKQGYGPFSDIEFEDGLWEVEAYKDGAAYELAVDSRTGAILSEHRDDAEHRPPQGALPLSQILRRLLKAGYTDIHDVSFERRYWEVEAYRPEGKRELHVHPMTGEVVSDRPDK